MTIDNLYDFLTNEDFKQPDTGNLFFPAYMFTYQAEKEYEIRQKILEFKDRLKRPNNYLDSLVINIYDEFIHFLKSKKILNDNLLNLFFEKEEDEGSEKLIQDLKDRTNSEEFYEYLSNKVNQHFVKTDKYKRVFLLLYGFGSIFPFLRTSVFLNNFQKYIKNYKLIIFYPGEYKDGSYFLFNKLDDKHLYRASWLNDFVQ